MLNSKYNIQEIIAGCLRSQSVYQRALVDDYSGLLYVICNRYLGDVHAAQDALQESWSLIFRNLATFDISKGEFEPWASTVTIRHCLNILAKKRVKVVELKTTTVNGKEQDLQMQIISSMSADHLLELVARLPENLRTVFNMIVIDGYSHKEVASALDITVINSRARLNRARSILKDRINALTKKESWINAI